MGGPGPSAGVGIPGTDPAGRSSYHGKTGVRTPLPGRVVNSLHRPIIPVVAAYLFRYNGTEDSLYYRRRRNSYVSFRKSASGRKVERPHLNNTRFLDIPGAILAVGLFCGGAFVRQQIAKAD